MFNFCGIGLRLWKKGVLLQPRIERSAAQEYGRENGYRFEMFLDTDQKRFQKVCRKRKINYLCNPEREFGKRRRDLKNIHKTVSRLIKKLQKSFGSLEKVFYFCTRKSGQDDRK